MKEDDKETFNDFKKKLKALLEDVDTTKNTLITNKSLSDDYFTYKTLNECMDFFSNDIINFKKFVTEKMVFCKKYGKVKTSKIKKEKSTNEEIAELEKEINNLKV